MKKRFLFFFCLFLSLILTSCDLLGGSLSEYVTEYTQNAAIERHSFTTTYPRDVNDTVCINSEGFIRLYLRNPMEYDIEFEYVFDNPLIQEYYDSNYAAYFTTIRYAYLSSDRTTYSMSFPASFRTAIDECAVMSDEGPVKDISGTLYAYEKKTHRPFGFYKLDLHADTPPEPISSYMMQLDQDSTGEFAQQAKYIVCFEVPRSARNNDFKTITINNDTWNVAYDFYRDMVPGGIQLTPASGNKGTLIVNPRSPDEPDDRPLAPTVYPLEYGADTFVRNTSGDFDTFYYITGDQRSDVERLYTITVSDAAGLSAACAVSSKAEKLGAPTLPVFEPGQTLTAGINGKYQFTVVPCNLTTSGNSVTGSTAIEYRIDILSNDYEIIDSGEWTTLPVKNGSYTLELEPKEYGENYKITARSKGTGYLQSEPAETIDFRVIRGNHFFVSSSEGYDGEGYTGTLTKPYRTFSKALEAIMEYQEELTKFPDVPVNSYYIDVPQNYTASAAFTESYLINNDSTSFAGNLTIQGVDDNGNALSGDSRRTIDAGSSVGLLSWSAVANNTATLSLKNLTFTNGCSNTSGQYAGLFFKTISVQGNPDNNNEKLHVTITNCDITHMTGSYGYGIYFYGGNSGSSDTSTSTVTITDCTISDNEKTGINHSYAAQGISSYEKLILAGNTKIQNNSDGGVSESLGLIIKSKDVTISNNTGYGVSAGAWAKIDIEGATITNNTDSSGKACNLKLYTNNLINVTGSLSGSKIGVTLADEETDAGTVFTTGFKANNPSLKPSDIFTSDKADDGGNALPIGYGSADDAAKKEAALYTPGHGTITPDISGNDVRFSLNKNTLWEKATGNDRNITLSITDSSGNAVTVKDLHIKLLFAGDEIPGCDFTSREFTIPDSVKAGYYQLKVTATCNDIPQSATIDFEVFQAPLISSLTSAPTEGTLVASTANDLTQLATWVNGGSTLENVTIILDSDVTITGTSGFSGIGYIDANNAMIPFTGTFDGQGHTVTLDIVTDETKQTLGLFGCIKLAHIKNVTVTGTITASGTSYVSGIAGYSSFGGNSTIENCISEVTISTSSSSYTGGIVGMVASDCTFINCINNGNITGNGNIGGIVGGKAASGGTDTVTLYNCVNNGAVTAVSSGTPGGLVGSVSTYNLVAINCANTGTVRLNDNPKSEVYGGSYSTQSKTYKNIIYLQNSGSGKFDEGLYTDEIHAETSLSAIVSRLNSWIDSQPESERATYRKWKVSADGTKIEFMD